MKRKKMYFKIVEIINQFRSRWRRYNTKWGSWWSRHSGMLMVQYWVWIWPAVRFVEARVWFYWFAYIILPCFGLWIRSFTNYVLSLLWICWVSTFINMYLLHVCFHNLQNFRAKDKEKSLEILVTIIKKQG